jgi:hypothetical protein
MFMDSDCKSNLRTEHVLYYIKKNGGSDRERFENKINHAGNWIMYNNLPAGDYEVVTTLHGNSGNTGTFNYGTVAMGTKQTPKWKN